MKRFLASAAVSILLLAQPAHAQSILRDAETEAMFNDMSAPLIKAAGLSPRDVRVVLINDDEFHLIAQARAGAGPLLAEAVEHHECFSGTTECREHKRN